MIDDTRHLFLKITLWYHMKTVWYRTKKVWNHTPESCLWRIDTVASCQFNVTM
jgi:hypothetical protein